MSRRFQAECPDRGHGSLVSEACCREKSAYFILGPGATIVGYVAAIVESNRLVAREKLASPGESEATTNVPMLLQVYVEQEFRRRGYARAALRLLLRGHDSLLVEEPTWPLLQLLKRVGFRPVGNSQDDAEGPVTVTLLRCAAGGA